MQRGPAVYRLAHNAHGRRRATGSYAYKYNAHGTRRVRSLAIATPPSSPLSHADLYLFRTSESYVLLGSVHRQGPLLYCNDLVILRGKMYLAALLQMSWHGARALKCKNEAQPPPRLVREILIKMDTSVF